MAPKDLNLGKISTKRSRSDGNSTSSEECSFFVSKSTKNRGRPKIRKGQKQ
jgi:hypothetical protein